MPTSQTSSLGVGIGTALLAIAFALPSTQALGQGRGSGGGGGGLGGQRMPMGNDSHGSGGSRHDHGSAFDRHDSTGRVPAAGLVGRWWDDSHYTHSLGIDAGQQKRMDQVFAANRDQLQKLYDNLQREKVQLARVSGAGTSEEVLDAQIDRVSVARTELQKASAHVNLQLRKELTPDQVAKLDAETTAR